MFTYYNDADIAYYNMLEHMEITENLDFDSLKASERVKNAEVYYPDGEYAFTHECAIIKYHGILFASWYNCQKNELKGVTPIRGRYSKDDSKTWSDIETYAMDETAEILYCPPVYGICGDKLYMLVNVMYKLPDHIHALDLFMFSEETFKFEKLWSRSIPFKLNTNVYTLPNGKLMLPGRIAELDGFPNTPAVLISDSGKIDADWRLVYIASDGNLADGSKLVNPELSAVVMGKRIYMFCRDDDREVPLLYMSDDSGESWSIPYSHDIPFSNSKIYSGTLSDGRNYVIGNRYPGRSRLAVLFSKKGEFMFDSGLILQNGRSEQFGYGGKQWSYPVAYEADGKLYVIYSACIDDEDTDNRGAVVSIIEL